MTNGEGPDSLDSKLRATDESTRDATQDWYRRYYAKRGVDRNDLLENAEVLFQSLAFDVANVRALRGLAIERASARVLDVGCGTGSSILTFLRLGFEAGNLAGVDISPARLEKARSAFPNVDFRCEGANRMSFGTEYFDVVSESTMFVQLTDEILAKEIAGEMIRVVKPGGFIVLVDWRYGKPGNREYCAVSRSRIARLFEVGTQTTVERRARGALIPPIGRWLSRRASWAYFLIHALLPFLAGQITTVLRKR